MANTQGWPWGILFVCTCLFVPVSAYYMPVLHLVVSTHQMNDMKCVAALSTCIKQKIFNFMHAARCSSPLTSADRDTDQHWEATIRADLKCNLRPRAASGWFNLDLFPSWPQVDDWISELPLALSGPGVCNGREVVYCLQSAWSEARTDELPADTVCSDVDRRLIANDGDFVRLSQHQSEALMLTS